MAQPVIAVIDDDQTMLDMIGTVLAEEGYTVLRWSEGKTAYDWIREHRPDLVIVDLRMEHPQAGWIIIHMLRVDAAMANLPIIVCSGDRDYIRINQEMLRERRCEVLLKPFDVDTLLNKVAGLLNSTTDDQSGQFPDGAGTYASTVRDLLQASTRRVRHALRRSSLKRGER